MPAARRLHRHERPHLGSSQGAQERRREPLRGDLSHAAVALALALGLFAGAAAAQEAFDVEPGLPPRGTLALLEWPALSGHDASDCGTTTHEAVPVYAAAEGRRRVGELLPIAVGVDRGRCRAPRLHWRDGREQALPIREHAYEAPALAVAERHGRRLRLALASGEAWREPDAEARLHPLVQLLQENLAYLPAGRTPMLCAAADQERPLRVLAGRDVDALPWIEVELLDAACADREPQVLARGWLRAIGEDGIVNAWFWSRGC